MWSRLNIALHCKACPRRRKIYQRRRTVCTKLPRKLGEMYRPPLANGIGDRAMDEASIAEDDLERWRPLVAEGKFVSTRRSASGKLREIR